MATFRRRGENSFQIEVYLGRDQSGKRKMYRETFYGTYRQAQRRAMELELALKKPKSGPRQAQTVAEYLDQWMERIQGTVAESTYHTYMCHVRRLQTYLEDVSMHNLTSGQLQDALMELLQEEISRRTIRGMYGTLKTALRQAVAWGVLDKDPSEGLRSPRVPRQEKKVLSAEELQRLLLAARQYKHYPVIRLLAVTGMRLGEALGLQWNDIDWKKGTVTVQRSVNTRDRKVKPDTKTAGSRRTLPLDAETLEVLRQLYEQEKKSKVRSLQRNTLVFHADDDPSRPLRAGAVWRTLTRALAAAGLPHLRVHDLRHTAGSLLVAAGVPLPTVAEFLGHSSPATTAAVYAHAVGRKVNVADVLTDSPLNSPSKTAKP